MEKKQRSSYGENCICEEKEVDLSLDCYTKQFGEKKGTTKFYLSVEVHAGSAN